MSPMPRRTFTAWLAGLPLVASAGRPRLWDVGLASPSPSLSTDALGWLAHLDRKVSLGGTWTKHDRVGPQWDTTSFEPTMHYARYEPTWLAWSMGLMVETTPAWREEYAKILRFLADRYVEYWSFWEWVEHRTDDPQRAAYPAALRRMIPEGQFGRYNLPGWAGNGTRQEPYDPDPIRAGGRFSLMYKGYLNLVLSMYRYVSDDGRYERPFEVRYDEQLAWTYDHRRLNEILAEQWAAHEEGIACEVTKVYPWCNTLAGAATRLYDGIHGTRFADGYYRWQRYFASHYVGSDTGHGPDWLMGYFDPDLGVGLADHGAQNGANWVATLWHGIAVDEAQFRPLYDSLIRLLYRPGPDGTGHLAARGGTDVDLNLVTGLGAALAAEMGDQERAAAMRRWIMARYQPLRDQALGEFAFGFGLNEAWPRGQPNAWVMPALLVERAGQWRDLFRRPNLDKFREPTVEGIDFPRIRVTTARYRRDERILDLAVVPGAPRESGQPTRFRVTRLPRGARVAVAIDGGSETERVPTDGQLTVETRIESHRFQFRLVD